MMNDTGKQAIDYINSVTWRESKLGLRRMRELAQRMGNPQNRLRFIHVAGTNGKGSVCAMLASVLCQAGYRVGLFTSPYISCFNERMQVNGEAIPNGELAACTERMKSFAEAMEDHPTEFEMGFAVALEWFSRRACDVVVLEVGLGGRLDATNIIDTPLVAAITAIDLDHTQYLGDTKEAIAGEKAGIIKPGGQVVCAPQTPGVLRVLEEACREAGAHLHVAGAPDLQVSRRTPDGQVFSVGGLENLRLPLLGVYQPANAALALAVLQCLPAQGYAVDEKAIRAGLAAVRWPARFQWVRRAPDVIVDGGHNPQGARALAESLRTYFPGRKVLLLTGVMRDKDYAAMYRELLPLAKGAVCVAPAYGRALPPEELAGTLRALGFARVQAAPSVAEGVRTVLQMARPTDVVCAFGTFYMAGEVLARLPEWG